jgi:hypothetical protein
MAKSTLAEGKVDKKSKAYEDLLNKKEAYDYSKSMLAQAKKERDLRKLKSYSSELSAAINIPMAEEPVETKYRKPRGKGKEKDTP